MSISKISDVFIKRSELSSDELKNNKNIMISRKEVIKTIPCDCLKCPNLEFAKTKTEWRWRIFKLPNKNNETIEISMKRPNEERKYINKLGEWIQCEVSEEFDVYVTSSYYNYI